MTNINNYYEKYVEAQNIRNISTMKLMARPRPGRQFRFVLILTRNNGSELKTGQGGVEIISDYAWGISMTVH